MAKEILQETTARLMLLAMLLSNVFRAQVMAEAFNDDFQFHGDSGYGPSCTGTGLAKP